MENAADIIAGYEFTLRQIVKAADKVKDGSDFAEDALEHVRELAENALAEREQ